MKITTLIENLVTSSYLVAEHGLSLFIDTGKHKVLFDTGQTGLFIQNAQKLEIDLTQIDILILSHGHFDHTGGLYSFLEINKTAKVIAKNGIFIPKYNGKSRFIGTPFKEDALAGRIDYISTITEIVPDLYIFPTIKLEYKVDTNFNKLFTQKNDTFYPEKFEDELFVAIKKNNSVNIITACSHRGITNICETAMQYFNLPINLILGGFHMNECTEEQYSHIVQYFKTIQPKLLGVCHCSGVDKYAKLEQDCNAKVFYNFTGNEITIK